MEIRDIDSLRLHPHAAIVPEQPVNQYALLKADIEANGIQDPIHITEDGLILDGRHRRKIAMDLKKTSVPVQIVETADSFRYMIGRALHQKHLADWQRYELSVALTSHLAKEAATNQSKGGKGEALTDLSKAINTRKERAHLSGLSEGTIAKLNKIYEHGQFMYRGENGAVVLDDMGRPEVLGKGSPTILALLQNGDLSVDRASQLIKSAIKTGELIQRSKTAPEGVIIPDTSDGSPLNKIMLGDSLAEGSQNAMTVVPNNSVALIVTSPPYPLPGDKVAYGVYTYDGNYKKYLLQMRNWLREAFRILRDGGRIAINCGVVSNFPKDGQDGDMLLDVPSDITRIAKRIGFTLRDKICWYKQKCDGNRRHVGSIASPACPRMMRNWEDVLIFHKGSKRLDGDRARIDILPKNFDRWTVGYWKITPIRRAQSQHRCAFPLELARRLIQMYSYVGDTIMDPFSGSGTTCLAAKMLKRNYIGFDNDEVQIKKSIKALESPPAKFDDALRFPSATYQRARKRYKKRESE